MTNKDENGQGHFDTKKVYQTHGFCNPDFSRGRVDHELHNVNRNTSILEAGSV